MITRTLRYERDTTNVATRRKESGVALIIAIIALLLVTAVAAGMILVSRSETSVDANYRDQQVALFAAKAGLQEARDRMLAGNANPIVLPTVLPSGTGSIADYIIQTGIAPWTQGISVYGVSTYDSEFANEINGTSTISGSASYLSYSTQSTYSGPTSNPLAYQWVRINLKTDRSAYTNGTNPYYVDGNSANANNQVCWDQVNLHEVVIPSSDANCQQASSNYQPVYEITSFAVTRNGTRRMLQDEVAALNFNLNLQAPLTIPGTVGSFSGGNSKNYQINGTSGSGSAPAVPGCTPSGAGPAISVSNSVSASTVDGGLPRASNYTGSDCSYYSGIQGCVGNASLPTSMQTPTELEQTLTEIEQNSNVCLGCSGAGGGTYSFSNVTSSLPGGTWTNSSDNPQTIYVNGDLDISGSNTGSGILVVTGNLIYDGNSSWNGIILVVGEGVTTYQVNGGGNGSFNGAIFVATTKDTNGNVLPNYGTADFNINGGGGSGVFYNNCWVSSVEKPVSYLMLSSKDISY